MEKEGREHYRSVIYSSNSLGVLWGLQTGRSVHMGWGIPVLVHEYLDVYFKRAANEEVTLVVCFPPRSFSII